MNPAKITLISVLLLSLSCSEGLDKPVDKTSTRLPFDNFLLSTRVGGTRPAIFNTWINDSGSGASDFYQYRESDGVIEIPKECYQEYTKTGTQVTAVAGCTLVRSGTINPNGVLWPQTLTYRVTMIADTQTMKVISAILEFEHYNQVIDFTAVSEIEILNVNGYDERVMTGSPGQVYNPDYFDTDENYLLNLRCVFSEII